MTLLAVVGAAVLFVSEVPIAEWGLRSLVRVDAPTGADAVVVLSGGRLAGAGLSDSSMSRLMQGLRLFRQHFADTLILLGPASYPDSRSDASILAEVAIELGVPASAIIVDGEAQGTFEQAQTVARLLRERNQTSVLLVTSSSHSFRAAKTFEKAGIQVTSIPTGPSVTESSPTSWRTFANPVAMSDRLCQLPGVVSEYVAMAVYRWRGWM